MKFHHTRLIILPFFVCLACLLFLLINNSGYAQNQSDYINLVRVMRFEKTGLSNPASVTYSSSPNVFRVIEFHGNADRLSGIVVVNDISVFGHPLGSTPIKIGIDDPINVVMDNKFNRLLFYQASSQQIIEVNETSDGTLDPNSLVFTDASFFGVIDPRGLTFDPIHGYLYLLDAVGPRLVRVTLQPDGSFSGAAVDAVDLSWAIDKNLRGIAFDPTSGNIHVVSPSERNLYELNVSGTEVAVRDLSEFNLSNPQAILFAPSGDQTDDPQELSLYLTDCGEINNPQTELMTSEKVASPSDQGKIVELTMIQPVAQAIANFTSALVKTTNLAAISPPSPDTSGLAYISSTNTLLASDSEVEETVNKITHFSGANLWEMSLTGSLVRTANISSVPPTYVSMTDEPTGVAWNPGNGHYYFTDDNRGRVFDLNPGADQLVGTIDDTWTYFSTTGSGNGDPEGITYDSWNNQLFVVDGVNMEIYQYTLAGSLVSQFDVQTFGVSDPESVEFNPASGTLFVLGTNPIIVETSTSGSLIQSIDTSANNAEKPAGLAYAPASDGSVGNHFYIVDRGIDNNDDPNIIDGKMYEMTAPGSSLPGNTPPVVSAGIDQSIDIGANAVLFGTAIDDGLPNPPGMITVSWTMTNGPGTVTFAHPNAATTTASFSLVGTYILRLTANDGQLSAFDETTITVTSSGYSYTLDVRVSAYPDDAEENSSGTVKTASPDLQLVLATTLQTVGIRFTGITIPKNAIIENAFIQFESETTDSMATSLTLWGEANDNPVTFTGTAYNISSRPRTAVSVGWVPAPWTAINQADTAERTSNLSPIIQEIVNRQGWTSGNSIVIIIGGTGRRVAMSYDYLPSGAPLLHVEYTLRANTSTPTLTPSSTNTPTQTPVPTSTPTPTSSSTPSSTASPTNTPTATASSTATPTPPSTDTVTPTQSPTATITSSPTNTATFVSSPTSTPTPLPSSTASPTSNSVPVSTPVPTSTSTSTPSQTATPIPLPSSTITPTSSNTPTSTIPPTNTQTPTPINTSTNTPQPTYTFTPTSSYTPTSQPSPTVYALDVRVSAYPDDAEENSSGTVKTASPDLQLVLATTLQTVGIRFTGITIPKNAIIENAFIQFESETTDSMATSLTLWGEANDNPVTFTGTAYNISSRPRTAASVGWVPAPWTAINQADMAERTSNLSPIIQEIVNRQGWTSGNSIVIIIGGTGRRVAMSYDYLPSGAPLLHVEYTLRANTSTPTLTPSSTNTPTQTPVPTSTPTPTSSSTPSSTASPTNTPTATASSTPTSTAWLTSTHTPTPLNTSTNTPQPTYTFTPTTSYTPTRQPSPTNTFTPTSTRTPTGPFVLEVRVSASSDDAEESASGVMTLTDTDLELVYDASNQKVGIRFKNLQIPKGSVILNAYVQFQASGINSEATSLIIRGQASDNANSFSRSKRNISSRVTTSSSISWSPASWIVLNDAGVNQRTLDISSIIQEIINRPLWSSGNSIVIIITGSGVRSAWSYNGLPAGAPLLHIEFMIP